MSKSLLLVGTRKGLFVLESDDRRDWSVRGPYCESWPVYNAALDRDSGTIYAAASSEWFGSAIWRSADLGETWEHSSEGLSYPEGGELKLSKVSHVMPAHGRLLVGAEAAGLFESTDGGKTFSLLTTFEGQEGREAWNDPAQQPPGHLGLSAIIPHPDEARPLLGDRPGLQPLRDDRRRPDVDAAQQGSAPGLAGRVRGDRLLRPQGRAGLRLRAHVPAEPRRHAPQRRRRQVVDGDHRRPADGVRLRRGDPPARPRHLLRHPARPRPRPDDAGRQGGRLAHARRGLELGAARPRPARRRTPTSASSARGWRSTATTRPASTSARARGSCSGASTKARAGAGSAASSPGSPR